MCLHSVLPHLLEGYKKPVVIPKSDIVGSKEAIELDKEFVKETKAIASNTNAGSWIVRARQASAQTFQARIVDSLENVRKHATLLDKSRHIHFCNWYENDSRIIYSTHREALSI